MFIIISVSDRKLLETGKDAEEKRGSIAGAPLSFFLLFKL
tara:strand:+ start:318 stop:437 length:120 start_codon:yes stop_codon:yes gene_type:complete